MQLVSVALAIYGLLKAASYAFLRTHLTVVGIVWEDHFNTSQRVSGHAQSLIESRRIRQKSKFCYNKVLQPIEALFFTTRLHQAL